MLIKIQINMLIPKLHSISFSHMGDPKAPKLNREKTEIISLRNEFVVIKKKKNKQADQTHQNCVP